LNEKRPRSELYVDNQIVWVGTFCSSTRSALPHLALFPLSDMEIGAKIAGDESTN